MTVSSSTNSASYSGNGSTTVFAYGFKIFEDSDLTVTLVDDTTEVETVQTLTTDYTVSNAGNDSGGNVTFVTAPASGKTVKIERDIAFTQTTAYTENDAFPAKAHEDALDRLTMLTQQNKAKTDTIDDKAPKASPTFTGTVSFGDDVKAVFGTGSDLEIFHDGSNSIISDTGTGDLKLRQGSNDKLTITTAGATVTGTIAASTGDFNSTQTGTLRIETSSTPSGGSVGTAGDITWDSSYLYVCVATNTWKRVALSTIGGGGA